jgi:AcrR family transcriptional regulator
MCLISDVCLRTQLIHQVDTHVQLPTIAGPSVPITWPCGQGAPPLHWRGVTAATETPRRRDAQRNREAILAAARELFAECADVPLYEVARRAGVGQATLYRNFPDRRDLAAALLLDEMQHTEQLAAEHASDPDAFFVLLRSVVDTVARFRTLGELAREDSCLGSALHSRRLRLRELLKEPLRAAKAAGTVRCDVTIDDVFLVVLMVKGAIDGADDPVARVAAAGRALALLLDGLTPSSAA